MKTSPSGGLKSKAPLTTSITVPPAFVESADPVRSISSDSFLCSTMHDPHGSKDSKTPAGAEPAGVRKGGVGTLHQGEERVDVLFGRGPAGGEAHDRVVVVRLFPEAHADLFGEGLVLVVGEFDKGLVRRGVEEELIALFLQALAELFGEADGLGAVLS